MNGGATEKHMKFSFDLGFKGKTQEFYNPSASPFKFLLTKNETEEVNGIIAFEKYMFMWFDFDSTIFIRIILYAHVNKIMRLCVVHVH